MTLSLNKSLSFLKWKIFILVIFIITIEHITRFSIKVVIKGNTMENNYDFLLKIGFTLNEAKVYLALIKNRAMNGYEVAKVSGVSRSLVYDVLDRLASKGYVIKCEGEINFYTAWECRQKLGLNRKDKYAQNRRN